MNFIELKKEQVRLAPKVILHDGFSSIKLIGAVDCTVTLDHKLLACVVVCEFPSCKLVEKKTYVLSDPLPYHPEFVAYREMPAMIEAYNLLELEPDVLLVSGTGVLHVRRLGLASHLGLALNKPTFGVSEHLPLGKVEKGRIFVGPEIVGFEIKTREFSNPLYVSPGHLVSLGSTLSIISQLIQYPHKMPEPLHIARKMAKRKIKEGNMSANVLIENNSTIGALP